MFITKVFHVERETGEILPRDDIVKKKYIIISKSESSIKKRGNIIKTIIYECERSKQQRLFD